MTTIILSLILTLFRLSPILLHSFNFRAWFYKSNQLTNLIDTQLTFTCSQSPIETLEQQINVILNKQMLAGYQLKDTFWYYFQLPENNHS